MRSVSADHSERTQGAVKYQMPERQIIIFPVIRQVRAVDGFQGLIFEEF